MLRRDDTVTIFGGSGFIGRSLVHRLAKTGCRIRIAGRDPSKAAKLRPCGAVGQIVPVACNIHDPGSVAAALGPAKAVVNMIGILEEKGPNSFQAVHANFPARLAELASSIGAERFVQISALGADPDSASAYARTKAGGEAAVREHFKGATILRPSIVFGPEDSFFNRFASMATVSPALPLIGGGQTRFQPVYVGDVAQALMAALTDEKTPSKTYELGGPQIYTFRELMELTLKEIRRERALVSIPFKVAETMGKVAQNLPGAPITFDQVQLLKSDNVVSKGAMTLKTLGITPEAVEVIIPTYLDRFRAGGRFNRGGAYQLGER